MEAVVKVGGSLAENPANLRVLCRELTKQSKKHKILIVPGGGRFADKVREIDRAFGVSSTVAHRMAILGMDQFGLLLSDITRDSQTTYSLQMAKKLSADGILPILLPSRFMFREDRLEHSWDITSDSIAAHVALKVHAEKLILATDVDGIFSNNPKKDLNAELREKLPVSELLRWNKRTSVDKFLPRMLSETRLNCFVANGKHPKRIKDILENHETVCTRIIV